jgi:hypothetical protein
MCKLFVLFRKFGYFISPQVYPIKEPEVKLITHLRDKLYLVFRPFRSILIKLIILITIVIIKLVLKYGLFSGVNNMLIGLIIMCFISIIYLALNYKKTENLNSYILKLVYAPLYMGIIITLDFLCISLICYICFI